MRPLRWVLIQYDSSLFFFKENKNRTEIDALEEHATKIKKVIMEKGKEAKSSK